MTTRRWWWLLFSALCLGASIAPPQFQWQRGAGGLLSDARLAGVDAPRVVGMKIYTDWGVLQPSHYEAVGSQNEQTPQTRQRQEGQMQIVEVEGALKDRDGKPCGLCYHVVQRVSTDGMTLDIGLTADRAFEKMNGFLAVALSFAGASEWFAQTREGWLFRDLDSAGRVFQSASTPLPERGGVLGIGNGKTGWALLATAEAEEPAGSLDNALIHADRNGNGSFFFAWCDGKTARQIRAGETWRLTLRLRYSRMETLFQEGGAR